MGHEPNTTLKPLVKIPKSPEACWKWLGRVNDKGIPMKEHNGRSVAARRWLWEQLFGKLPPGIQVFNTCGNMDCIRPDHSRAGLPAEKVGYTHGILTPEDIVEIKAARNAGPFEKEAIRRKLGVDEAYMRAVWRGDTWKHVKDKRTRRRTEVATQRGPS